MKLSKFPPFSAVGLVSVFEHGDVRPFIQVKAHCYLHHREDIHSAMLRDAKWKLQRAGVSEDRLKEIYFEYEGTDSLLAVEPKGVRCEFGDKIEAFFDYPDIKKRDILIRQRRLMPDDANSMRAMYDPQTETAVAA